MDEFQSDPARLKQTLNELSALVGGHLRKSNLKGRTVKLKLRWSDFTTLTRQSTLNSPTDMEDEIAKTALELMKSVRKSNQAVRLIGVGVSGLGEPVRQLGLWDFDSEKSRKLQVVLDTLQEQIRKRCDQTG